jgi:hypothetical protein
MEDRRERPGEDCISEMSGIELSGGTNTVDRDPLLEWLASLSIVSIVRMEPVGDLVTGTESGTLIGLLTASLYDYQNQEET